MPKQKPSYISYGLADEDRIKSRRWLIGAAAVALTSAVLYPYTDYSPLKIDPELFKGLDDVFAKYVVLIAAVERAATVAVGVFRNQRSVDWSLRINRIGRILDMHEPSTSVLKRAHAKEKRFVTELQDNRIIEPIESVNESSPTLDGEYLGYLTSAKHAYEFQRARFNSRSNKYVALIVAVTGVFLAILGLSLFDDVFVPCQEVGAWQDGTLRFLDILITGGLLGGGSAGLNLAVTKVSEFADRKLPA